jgi:hypothetical protein
MTGLPDAVKLPVLPAPILPSITFSVTILTPTIEELDPRVLIVPVPMECANTNTSLMLNVDRTVMRSASACRNRARITQGGWQSMRILPHAEASGWNPHSHPNTLSLRTGLKQWHCIASM